MWRKELTPGIKLFAVFVFVLVAVPKANLKIGPLPVYLTDVLIFLLLCSVQKLPPLPRRRRLYSGTVSTLLIIALASEVAGMIRFGTLLDSAYMMGRTALAFSVFFLAAAYVRTRGDIELLLKAIAAGVIVTASLMILSSLPATRGMVSDLVFSHRFLEPASDRLQLRLDGAPERGIRGRTLVGVSILGATFINICWPFAALLLRWPWMIGKWRRIAFAACLLAPMGVLMSYSRGPLMASALVVIAVFFLGLRQMKRGILLPVAIGASIVFFIGIGSQVFYFERLERSFGTMLESPYENTRESERSLAYSEPFTHAVQNPGFLLAGEGVAVRYTASGIRAEQHGQATHAVFAMAYYSYGLIAALLYISLIARALFHVGTIALQRRRTLDKLLAQPLFLSLVAIVPWAMFGHAAVSTPRGAMLLFLIIGLVSATSLFRVPARRRPSRRQTHGHRRHPAFG
ncbi:hypothetical protein KUW17_22680 [Leisingera aquaemixtae]|uniref:O-antigen ligase family protein n=1 Tax=Leisingera TaxID=191028 RepID=UPI001C95C2BD|nr:MULTISPECIES: hypothetical protein [Leisingera]MBY6069560.1 hypothetical protein [Leisingera aquaemixtae]MCB4458424.1 hypothetical protein [Leisingera sp. McT4-56]